MRLRVVAVVAVVVALVSASPVAAQTLPDLAALANGSFTTPGLHRGVGPTTTPDPLGGTQWVVDSLDADGRTVPIPGPDVTGGRVPGVTFRTSQEGSGGFWGFDGCSEITGSYYVYAPVVQLGGSGSSTVCTVALFAGAFRHALSAAQPFVRSEGSLVFTSDRVRLVLRPAPAGGAPAGAFDLAQRLARQPWLGTSPEVAGIPLQVGGGSQSPAGAISLLFGDGCGALTAAAAVAWSQGRPQLTLTATSAWPPVPSGCAQRAGADRVRALLRSAPFVTIDQSTGALTLDGGGVTLSWRAAPATGAFVPPGAPTNQWGLERFTVGGRDVAPYGRLAVTLRSSWDGTDSCNAITGRTVEAAGTVLGIVSASTTASCPAEVTFAAPYRTLLASAAATRDGDRLTLTNGRATATFVPVTALDWLPAGGTDAASTLAAARLAGTSWKATAVVVRGTRFALAAPMRLRFRAPQVVSGSDGCNDFGPGWYAVAGTRIVMLPGPTTAKACPPVNRTTSATASYFARFAQAGAYTHTARALSFRRADVVLTYSRAA